MTEKETKQQTEDISKEELDKLDDDLHSIDMLYRSRCVQPPQGVSNVVVREIDEEKDSK